MSNRTLTADAFTEAAVAYRHVLLDPEGPHPDRELLEACERLRAIQAEWQRLWAACLDEPHGGPADQAFDVYSEKVWPAVHTADPDTGGGLLRRMVLDMPSTTEEGRKAKAAALVATEDAMEYVACDCHNDVCEMAMVVMREAAGDRALQVGSEAL